MTNDERKTYHIGDISIDANGIFHIHFVGKKFGQGEMRPLLISSADIGSAFKTVTKNLQRCRTDLMDKIQALNEVSDGNDSIN